MKIGFGQVIQTIGAKCFFSPEKCIVTGCTNIGIEKIKKIGKPGNHRKMVKTESKIRRFNKSFAIFAYKFVGV
jgi:hypothetical protein